MSTEKQRRQWRAGSKKYRLKFIAEHGVTPQQDWRRRNPEHCHAYDAAWRKENLAKTQKVQRDSKKRERADNKRQCVDAYGGKCQCCGETEINFLTVDHIDGKGARHRRRLGQKGSAIYTGSVMHKWLRAQGYPKDNFQILCYNCNCGRAINGGICPHQAVA